MKSAETRDRHNEEANSRDPGFQRAQIASRVSEPVLRRKRASTVVPDELAHAVKERRAILFAGAGLSMAVGLPSWEQFIAYLCKELGLEPPSSIGAGATYQTLAEYYLIRRGSIAPLLTWMKKNWKISSEQVRDSRIHNLIVSMQFPIIYTTNYDRNIESAFDAHEREYVKIANTRDIANIWEGVTQIVKFHGDFDDPNSMVIRETDYFSRLSFDSPLDIKFRSDTLGNTVLFIGYSMSDFNIRLLLHKLWSTWHGSGHEQHRPRSYIFMATPNAVQETILKQWGITPLVGKVDDPEQALTDFLAELKARMED